MNINDVKKIFDAIKEEIDNNKKELFVKEEDTLKIIDKQTKKEIMLLSLDLNEKIEVVSLLLTKEQKEKAFFVVQEYQYLIWKEDEKYFIKSNPKSSKDDIYECFNNEKELAEYILKYIEENYYLLFEE